MAHTEATTSPISFSQEQALYIHYEGTEDTKLLATAGSGKTFCIIHHICHVVKKGLVEPDEVYMLTFSKNAKDDFRTKIRKHNAQDYIFPKNVCTIDSFAYRMLGTAVASTIDVSLLSYAWMDELENNAPSTLLEKYKRLKSIKKVFVDEAQDLNEIQYRILTRMKEVCNCHSSMTIHMVGDPNQNIYQFRKASDRFLVNFSAETFYLTRNYRSQSHIVEFCSHLRPYKNVSITAETPKTQSLDVTFYAYDTPTTFEHLLMSTLHLFKANKIPLHKVAILAPTRGYIRNPLGMCKYKGLCYIANTLFHHNIPFKQFYSDNNDADAFETAKIKYKASFGHLNLMTYTSSKGLEWDYVIIIDANAHLISRMNYDQDKYLAEKYLLYVACSRPRKNLLVFTKTRYANPWFKDVPPDTYKIAPRCRDAFDFFDTKLLFEPLPQDSKGTNQLSPVFLGPSAIINKLDIDALYNYDKRLRGKHMMVAIHSPPPTPSVINVPESRAPFMRAFLNHLYYVYALGTQLPMNHHYIVDIHNILHNENVLVCNNERVMSWYFENRINMNWEAYDKIQSTLDGRVVAFIDSRFNRDKPFNSFTLVDKFYELYINSSLDIIRQYYTSYKETSTPSAKCIMNISRVAYAIRTTHYFYIKQAQEFEEVIYKENEVAINQLISLAKRHKDEGFLESIKTHVREEEHAMYFYYDRTRDGRHMNIRTCNTLSIKDILAGIAIQHIVNPSLPFTEFYTLQLSPPAVFKYTITITPDEREAIFDSLLQHATSHTGISA